MEWSALFQAFIFTIEKNTTDKQTTLLRDDRIHFRHQIVY